MRFVLDTVGGSVYLPEQEGLVLFGQGYIPIKRQLQESSPSLHSPGISPLKSPFLQSNSFNMKIALGGFCANCILILSDISALLLAPTFH